MFSAVNNGQMMLKLDIECWIVVALSAQNAIQGVAE
jgi:hypothetical protein